MTHELEEFLSSTFKLRKLLETVMPKEAIDYIISLIVKDGAHRKYLKIVEENE